MPTFDTPLPITLTVDFGLAVGEFEFVASDRADTVVTVRPGSEGRKVDLRAAAETRVVASGGTVLVEATRLRTNPFSRNGSAHVRVELPAGSRVRAVTAAGGFTCTGRLGACHLATHLGDVSVAHADGPVEISTDNGKVHVGTAADTVVINNNRGDSRVDDVAGPLRLTGVIGGMHVGRAGGDVEARTAHGTIRVDEVTSGAVSMTTAAGSLELGVSSGTAAWLDARTIGGRLRNSLETTAGPSGADRTVEVRARTYAGDIVIRRAG